MGPGLEGSLLVGLSVAKSLSVLLTIPLIPVNHIHGHIYAHIASDTPINYPCLALIVSGGHTEFIRIDSSQQFLKCGKTRDDAAGEVLDKVARYLNLGYPGGPIIEKVGKDGNEKAFQFPIPLRHTPFEFSFSGLKTAAIDLIDSLDPNTLPIPDICASFQYAIIRALMFKSIEACKLLGISHLLLAGGVTANQRLQQEFESQCAKESIAVTRIPPKLCTDNAAMIGLAAAHLSHYYELKPEDIYANSGLSV
jgi:N6-L-threonylcarbamoyladenine synthase